MPWEPLDQQLARAERQWCLRPSPCPYPCPYPYPRPGELQLLSLYQHLGENHWNFHKGRRDLVCYGHLRHLGKLLWGRGARICELADIWVIVDALRSPQARISRNPSDIKGFTPRDIAVIPGYSRELLCESTLSLLYPQGVCNLFLGLGYLFE